MNVISRSIFTLILCIVLNGCAVTTTRQSPVIFTEQTPQHDESAHTTNSLDELMRYHDSLYEKKASQLAWEYNYARNHFKDSPNAEDRLKYILLISIPDTAHTDIQTALTLLKDWPQEVTLPSNLASFRKLLIILLTELQTAKTNAKNLLQKLKTSEEHAQTLQKRIDAIKIMEKKPIRRIAP